MNSIKRRDMGIAGAIIVLSQVLTNFQSSHSITGEVQQLRDALQASKMEREQYFVRKTELSSVVGKIDKVSDQITSLKEQVAALRNQMEDRYSLEEFDPLVGALECTELVSRD